MDTVSAGEALEGEDPDLRFIGMPVRELDLGRLSPGFYASRGRAARWDGRNGQGETVASGVYLYRLEVDGRAIGMRRMVVVR